MPCFGFFSRLRKSKTSKQPHARPAPHDAPSAAFREQAQRIARIPVGGGVTQRTTSGTTSFHDASTYHTAVHNNRDSDACAHASGRDPSNFRVSGATFLTDSTGDTLIGSPVEADENDEKKKKTISGYGQDFGDKVSAWQGKPNGTAYDQREELTREDEELWARICM